jgi:hypothetical protein
LSQQIIDQKNQYNDIQQSVDTFPNNSIPFEISIPSFSKINKASIPVFVLSCFEEFKEKSSRIYLLCIWKDGTILWNAPALEWCLLKYKEQALSDIPCEYSWKKIDEKLIDQLLVSIPTEPNIHEYCLAFGVSTQFDIYFQHNKTFDVTRMSFFPSKENKSFLSLVPNIFERMNLIVEQSLKLIPKENFQSIDKGQITTLILVREIGNDRKLSLQ